MVLKYIRKLFGPRKKVEDSPLPPLPPLSAPAEPARRSGRPPEVVHRPIPRHLIDPDVVKIIHRLTRFGETAYIVGGGVRDLLLHRTPKDFDIGTSALPHDMRKLFRNCRIIGRRFRLAHIFFRDKIIEVATFRANLTSETEDPDLPEGEQKDLLIRSDNVFGTPETDAMRRDFTINALFYDVDNGNVIDYVGGLADLDAGLLRTIGDPRIRMREDPIRILRALRLAGRLGFRIDDATLRAIRDHRDEIRKAAIPRVLEDLLRMLRGGGAQAAYRLMRETGVLAVVLPELDGAIGGGSAHGPASGGSQSEQRAAVFWRALHAIDLATARGTEFSNATLLAVLLMPRVEPVIEGKDPDEKGGAGLAAAIDTVLDPIERRLNLPRRDRDRMRHLFLAQRRFIAGRRGARRFSPSAFISRPFFPEAFDLFEIMCSATGQHKDELHRWRERIASIASTRELASSDGHAAATPRPDDERSRSRHRPGGRGRPPLAGTEGRAGSGGSLFAPEGPERPELTDEEIALVYGTVLPPAHTGPGAEKPGRDRIIRHAGPGPDRPAHPAGSRPAAEPAPAEGRRRRRRRGGRKHRRSGGGGGAAAPGGSSQGGA